MKANVREHVEAALDSYLEIATEANGRASYALDNGDTQEALRFVVFSLEHITSALEALALSVRPEESNRE